MPPLLMMALLGPPPTYEYPPAKSESEDSTLGSEVDKWIKEGPSKERKELMLQALYEALPYAFANEKAARAVGRLLTKAIGGADRAPGERIFKHFRRK